MSEHFRDWGTNPPESHEAVIDIFQVENILALHLFRRLKHTAHLMDHLRGEHRKDGQLSAARMRLLVMLTLHDRMGRQEGILPSELSDHLGISRNAVSALLNGLEEQGLIERHLHPTDRRQLLVRITPHGKAAVHEHAPKFGAYLRDLFSALTEEEQVALLQLLDKLFASFIQRAVDMGITLPGMTTPEDD